MNYLSNFSNNLKYLREANNLKQEDIAKEIGLSRASISSYELGKAEPTLQSLISLAEFFSLSIDDLISSKLRSEIVKDPKLETLKDKFSKNKFSTNDLLESLYKKKDYLINEKSKLEMYLNIDLPEQIQTLDDIITAIEKTNCKKSTTSKFNEECSDELTIDVIDLDTYKEEIEYSKIPDYGAIPAGKISLTFEDSINFVSIPKNNLDSSKKYYVLHVSGDSMNKLYDDGEIILVEKTNCVYPGDIVIARIGSDATVKRVAFCCNKIKLMPESTNPKHKIQEFKSEDIIFQGKVIGKLSDYINL